MTYVLAATGSMAVALSGSGTRHPGRAQIRRSDVDDRLRLHGARGKQLRMAALAVRDGDDHPWCHGIPAAATMNLEALGAFALLCFSSLLALLNPLSVAPLYLALTAGYTREHQLRTLRTAILTGGIVLYFFAVLGGTLFQLFGITLEAFRIAGGIILFGIGMDMLQAKQSRVKATPEEEEEALHKDEIAITPLGIPLIVGPGSITTVMVLTGSATTGGHLVVLFITIPVVLAIVFAALAAAPRLVQHFGQTGLNVMTRIMGLLLTVIGVQFIIDGAQPVILALLRAAGGS